MLLVVNAALRSLREILRFHRLHWPRRLRRVKRRRETSHDGPLQQYIRFPVEDGLRSGIIRKSAALPDGDRLRVAARLFSIEKL